MCNVSMESLLFAVKLAGLPTLQMLGVVASGQPECMQLVAQCRLHLAALGSEVDQLAAAVATVADVVAAVAAVVVVVVVVASASVAAAAVVHKPVAQRQLK